MACKAFLFSICAAALCVEVPAGSPGLFVSRVSLQESPDAAELPDHIAYEFYFLRVAVLNAWAMTVERSGKTGNDLRSKISQPAGLDESQVRELRDVAVRSLLEARELDLKARGIIRQIRLRYHDGRLGFAQEPPALPPELSTLQAQRNSIFLRARDALHKEWGEKKFGEFDRFVRTTIGQ